MTIEGLLNLIVENEGTAKEEELRKKLDTGSLFWRIKTALLEEEYNCFGPVNSVVKYTSYAANNLWLYNK